MGWLRTIFLGDYGNHLDIKDVETSVERMRERLFDSRRSEESLEARVDALEKENAEIKLALAATLMLLEQNGVIVAGNVAKMADAADASDGVSDGKLSGPLI